MRKEIKKNLKKFLPLSLCCIIPILLLISVPIIGQYSKFGALTISFIAPLICPLIMGGALFFIFKGSGACCTDNKKG